MGEPYQAVSGQLSCYFFLFFFPQESAWKNDTIPLPRLIGAIIIGVAYGVQVQPKDDPNIDAAARMYGVLNTVLLPGAFLVVSVLNAHSFCYLVPSFFLFCLMYLHSIYHLIARMHSQFSDTSHLGSPVHPSNKKPKLGMGSARKQFYLHICRWNRQWWVN